MTLPENSLGKSKLKEGDVLNFIIRNKILLQDNQDYFILEDPFGQKHFIEASLYSGYELHTGQVIDCLVDRINCTGRIFLEPYRSFNSF